MTTSKKALLDALTKGGVEKMTTSLDEKKKIATISSQESHIEVMLDQIAIAPQVRVTTDEDHINDLAESIKLVGLEQSCVLRHFFDEDEKRELQNLYPKAKYVLAIGHHRMQALLKNGVKSETFKLAAKDRYKSKLDVLVAQFEENVARAAMTVFDSANGVWMSHQAAPELTYEQLGQRLRMSKGLISRYIAIAQKIDKDSMKVLKDWGVNSINAAYNISTLITDGLDWQAILKSNAVDSEGVFKPEMITERLVNQIKANLKKPKVEKVEVPQESTVIDDDIPSNGIQNESPIDPKVVEDSPVAAKDIEESEKHDTDDAPAKTGTSSAPPTSQPTQPTTESVKTSTDTTKPAVIVNSHDFLSGAAFVLGQDPDLTTVDIAQLLKAGGLRFELNDHCQSILKQLKEMIM